VQRRAAGTAEPTHVPSIVDEVLRSPGQPLDAATRAFMEPRFGYDFSRVRVHTDSKAADSAESVDSQAYTVGQGIVFSEGHYAPATAAGRQLLAHELAHVIQQNGTLLGSLQRRCGETTPPEQNQATIRGAIVRQGEAQVGEHYLWSTEGERPGEGDVIDNPSYQCVAQVANGCVCAGKHLDPQVSAWPRLQQTVGDAELEGYIGTHSFLRQEGASSCGGGCGATAGSDIWGDCCIGHRHFDCSGFVFWCYNQAGYNISRLTVRDYQACDRDITQSALQPGDLCYIGNTHIGIYAGNGRVVEARSHAHGVVLSGLAGRGWTSFGSLFEATSGGPPTPETARIELEEPIEIRGVACTCDPPTEQYYDAQTFGFVSSIRPLITSIAGRRGVPGAAVAGAIADEYNTRRGISGTVDDIQDAVIDSLPEFSIDIDRFFDIHWKLLNTLENDIGPANIKVRTALELVQRGELTVPGSPPSDIQVNRIVDYLLTERGTVEATTAVIARAQRLFGPYLTEHGEELAEAVLVEYFKQGERYFDRFSRAAATNPNHRICPGDGGCRFWHNRERIQALLRPTL
jgi:cell wall-associated NlpC family hydrolase